ncbi:hypothetical protein PF006_g18266 [Phytophthora fragariae]|uniref:Uncharacterized protein n=1 Tax=Phytophthora fragariae TaxID=53985 RepID=A0A6A3SMF4_9STRA|nr:hypothetical protein PF006_g18266 [Phytophthora fragariae]
MRSWTRTRGTQDTDVKTLCAGKSAVQNEIFAISVLAQCARTRVPAGTLQEGCTWLDSSVSGYVSFVGISLARPTKAATPGAVGIRMTASEYAEERAIPTPTSPLQATAILDPTRRTEGRHVAAATATNPASTPTIVWWSGSHENR